MHSIFTSETNTKIILKSQTENKDIRIMQTTTRVRKSALLTSDELKDLKAFIKKELTRIDAAEKLDITLPTLSKLEKKGRGAPKSIEKVKAILYPTLKK